MLINNGEPFTLKKTSFLGWFFLSLIQVLIGIKEDNNVRHMGLMEFMKPQDRKILFKLHRQLITNEDKNFVYLDPVLQGRIKYRNLTKAGKFRIPSFEEWIV
jgi:DNA ligase 1